MPSDEISTRENILELLQDSIVEVKFTKKDGTERVLNCTLSKQIVPPPSKDPITQTKVRTINEALIVAWDVDKNDWRSFRVDSVISFEQKQAVDGN